MTDPITLTKSADGRASKFVDPIPMWDDGGALIVEGVEQLKVFHMHPTLGI